MKKSHPKIPLKIFYFSKLNLVSIVKGNPYMNLSFFIYFVKYFNNRL